LTFCIEPNFVERCLEEPTLLCSLDDIQWQDLFRILRYNDLVATLASTIAIYGVPIESDYAQKHLISARTYSNRQSQQVINEAHNLTSLLDEIKIYPTFLKGAAYSIAKDKNAQGRLMSDVDILVTKAYLPDIEMKLKEHGWHEKEVSDYDDNYYRKWSHELPPYYHHESGTTLDIHHTLIPPITGKRVPIEHILDSAEVHEGLYILPLEWRLLHCIIHFFYNEDYDKPFRDFWDIKCLIDLAFNEKKLENVLEIAKQYGFKSELVYCLLLLELKYERPYSRQLNGLLSINLKEKLFVRYVLSHCVVLRHRLTDTIQTKVCAFIMFIRGHLKKMPLKILIPHAGIKSYRGVVSLLLGKHHFD
jgi:hypothetical protein